MTQTCKQDDLDGQHYSQKTPGHLLEEEIRCRQDNESKVKVFF